MMTLLKQGMVRRTSRRQMEPHIPSGEVGIWVFIFWDMLVFALFFGMFMYYRGANSALMEESQKALNPNFGVVNTLLLLASSLVVVVAVNAVRDGHREIASWFIGVAFLCGIAFSALKIVEYSQKFGEGINPTTNIFFTLYFLLTGVHWLHLVIGLGVLAVLFRLTRKREFTSGNFAFLEGGACFWHMVDLLWIVVFPLLYLVK
jgi:nitric oxide reductase NorE protein